MCLDMGGNVVTGRKCKPSDSRVRIEHTSALVDVPFYCPLLCMTSIARGTGWIKTVHSKSYRKTAQTLFKLYQCTEMNSNSQIDTKGF